MYDVESPEYIAWADNVGADMEEYDSLFEDAYAGEWENVREFLEDFMDNTGAFSGVSETLVNFFDWNRFEKEMLMSDIWTENANNGTIYIYWNV